MPAQLIRSTLTIVIATFFLAIIPFSASAATMGAVISAVVPPNVSLVTRPDVMAIYTLGEFQVKMVSTGMTLCSWTRINNGNVVAINYFPAE